MTEHPFLETSRTLLSRPSGRPGVLPGPNIRRSISTTYYALFHFLVDGACSDLLGTDPQLSARRRLFARSFDHKGLKAALSLVQEPTIRRGLVQLFMRYPASWTGPVQVPPFARQMAETFLDAQANRNAADYNFNESFTERDAQAMIDGAEDAMRNWRQCYAVEDQRFKSGIFALMAMGGGLRSD